ncbi:MULTISPECIES: NUDIX hydrolase [Asticcacaulis]|uniref:NUDIX hydrolase n=1 Tax=Asticcacaulis TaxID=76890 RepID=UPI001AE14977|nr:MULTISPECIES: NUDIX hydrolase [Asticcacaulis]MBP2158810.1 8-oxo-dGTP diphosphatase [Asticcacaulis solisilvae]MDR6799856.1 8-oxo-dGTP diphosphatase [Asticcacaulis sp. BE141]
MQATKPKETQQRSYPIPCVGVVCWRGDEVLLIKRGRAPRQGEWSIPGGKVELGEALADAALRELLEETGVTAEMAGLVEVYEILEAEFHYVLIDYAAHWVAGEPRAGDDADEARFVPINDALLTVSRDDIIDVLQKSRTIIRRTRDMS